VGRRASRVARQVTPCAALSGRGRTRVQPPTRCLAHGATCLVPALAPAGAERPWGNPAPHAQRPPGRQQRVEEEGGNDRPGEKRRLRCLFGMFTHLIDPPGRHGRRCKAMGSPAPGAAPRGAAGCPERSEGSVTERSRRSRGQGAAVGAGLLSAPRRRNAAHGAFPDASGTACRTTRTGRTRGRRKLGKVHVERHPWHPPDAGVGLALAWSRRTEAVHADPGVPPGGNMV
jgi:hypothetical protein